MGSRRESLATLSGAQQACPPKERGGLQAPRSRLILQSIGFPSAKSDGERSMRGACPYVSPWHKRRGVSPQICDTLPPGNSRVALPILQGGFVAPLRVALHACVSPHDQHTLAMQMDAMQELTIRRGWTVIDARADMGSGATATPRCQGCCRGTSRVAFARA